jgi:hypothetical protein
MNIFYQSINAILLKLMSWVMKLTTNYNTLLTTWHATSSSLEIKSLLIFISRESKRYFEFLILNIQIY